jgi:hypothetical protein
MMDQERWRRVEELYYSALERDPQQRRSFLLGMCGADEDILQEVETLLDVEERRDFVIDKPAWKQLERSSALNRKDAEVLPGQTIRSRSLGAEVGPYVIEARLAAAAWERFIALETRGFGAWSH